jgi:cyclohexyl-isocyanide hydratase
MDQTIQRIIKTGMSRRDFALGVGALPLLPAASSALAAEQASAPVRPKVAMLAYPNMILLDLVGPQTVFSLLQADVRLVWKNKEPIATDVAVPLVATDTFETCPNDLDVLFVPGGLGGSIACMNDAAVLRFLAERGESARFVTSVCTGSLVLGAAGLLKGFGATSHWYVRELLPLMGASVVSGRVVEDRNRITGGGVTAGIDFGLTIAARLGGEEMARQIQLVIEYDPKPPFDAGSPEGAGAALTNRILQRRSQVIAAARDAARSAGERLGIQPASAR